MSDSNAIAGKHRTKAVLKKGSSDSAAVKLHHGGDGCWATSEQV